MFNPSPPILQFWLPRCPSATTCKPQLRCLNRLWSDENCECTSLWSWLQQQDCRPMPALCPFYDIRHKRHKEKQRPPLGGNGSKTREYSTNFNQRITKPKELIPKTFSPPNLNLEREKKDTTTLHQIPERFRETDIIRNLTFCQLFVRQLSATSVSGVNDIQQVKVSCHQLHQLLESKNFQSISRSF